MKKIILTLQAVLVLAAAAPAIDITVIQGTDIVDYQVLNSNYAALKQAGEELQDATNALNTAIAELPIDDLIEIAQAHQTAITNLQAVTNYQSGQISALKSATNDHQVAIAALNAASNAHQAAIASLVTATGVHQVAIANLNTATGIHQTAIAALNAASNAHQAAIASLVTATGVHQVAIANLNAATNNLPPVGSIIMFGSSNAPPGWLLCDGSLKLPEDYPALFAVIGYTFGFTPPYFELPNLKGRVPVGLATTGTFKPMGTKGGEETVTLTTAQMPSHVHVIKSWRPTDTGAVTVRNVAQPGPSDSYYYGPSTESAGGGQAHGNMPPYIVLNFIIKY